MTHPALTHSSCNEFAIEIKTHHIYLGAMFLVQLYQSHYLHIINLGRCFLSYFFFMCHPNGEGWPHHLIHRMHVKWVTAKNKLILNCSSICHQSCFLWHVFLFWLFFFWEFKSMCCEYCAFTRKINNFCNQLWPWKTETGLFRQKDLSCFLTCFDWPLENTQWSFSDLFSPLSCDFLSHDFGVYLRFVLYIQIYDDIDWLHANQRN